MIILFISAFRPKIPFSALLLLVCLFSAPSPRMMIADYRCFSAGGGVVIKPASRVSRLLSTRNSSVISNFVARFIEKLLSPFSTRFYYPYSPAATRILTIYLMPRRNSNLIGELRSQFTSDIKIRLKRVIIKYTHAPRKETLMDGAVGPTGRSGTNETGKMLPKQIFSVLIRRETKYKLIFMCVRWRA